MHLHHTPFQWPRECIGVIQCTSPNSAWPGLHWKPLDTAIGQLLAPYCPGGRQGNNQHNDDAKRTLFAGRFDGHRDARYNTAHIARWRRFVAFIKATKHHHWASTCSDRHQLDTPMPVVCSISSWKRARVDMLALNNNRGMTYQTDVKQLN